jgi:hypothetical protein
VFHGFLDHLLHGGIVHIHRRFYFGDRFLAGLNITSQGVKNAVGINLELHSDSRNASRGGMEIDGELSQAPVVASPFAFTLQDMNEHVLLVVDGGGEQFARLNWDRRIARNDNVH